MARRVRSVSLDTGKQYGRYDSMPLDHKLASPAPFLTEGVSSVPVPTNVNKEKSKTRPKPDAADETSPDNTTKATPKLRDRYRMGKIIGSGSFSSVRIVTDRETGVQWACKILRMQRPGIQPGPGESSVAEATNEILVLKALGRHTSNIFLREYFVESDKVYIIMEIVKGGELLYAVADRGYLPEEDTREIMKTIFEGLAHMHKHNIAHRDLKLENLLLVDPDCISTVKIADFGLSKMLKDNSKSSMGTVCGTPMYVSPEALNVLDEKVEREGYGIECDIWACGIIMFILLGGHPPFTDKHGKTDGGVGLFRKIQKGIYNFNDPVWELVSGGAKDLIMQLLTVDPTTRITADEALMHPWVKNLKWERSRSMP